MWSTFLWLHSRLITCLCLKIFTAWSPSPQKKSWLFEQNRCPPSTKDVIDLFKFKSRDTYYFLLSGKTWPLFLMPACEWKKVLVFVWNPLFSVNVFVNILRAYSVTFYFSMRCYHNLGIYKGIIPFLIFCRGCHDKSYVA